MINDSAVYGGKVGYKMLNINFHRINLRSPVPH